MSDEKYFAQQKRIAEARAKLIVAMDKSGERDMAIWMAALVEMLKRVSDRNLKADLEDQD